MFRVTDDYSIEANRGDIVFFTVSAFDGEYAYEFQPGDIVRLAIYDRKNADNCVLQRDFPVTEATENVLIYLYEADTKLGAVISKPAVYWYEIVLNPDTAPQTIVGYDEDGPKLFRLYPESSELHEYEPDEEDFPVVDSVLDLTSKRPLENMAIARAFVEMDERIKAIERLVENLTPESEGE